MTDSIRDHQGSIAEIDDEQLPVPKLHGAKHFLGFCRKKYRTSILDTISDTI